MREHADLPAMVRFVRNHVAEHFHAGRPRSSPSVSLKLRNAAATIAERFGEHLLAASRAVAQSRASLPRRTVRAIELPRNFQMRSREPDPLRAHVVHVREDRRNVADFAGRFCFPRGRWELFDQNLVHPVIGGENLDRGAGELRVEFALRRAHYALLLGQ